MMTEDFSCINLYETAQSPMPRKFSSGSVASRNPVAEPGGRPSTRVRPGQRKIPPLEKEKSILMPSALPFMRPEMEAKSFDEMRKEAADKVKSAAKAFVEKGKIMQQRIRSLSANQDSLGSFSDHPPNSSSTSTFKARSPGMLACSRCDRGLDHQYKHFCSECKHVFCAACSSFKQDSTSTERSSLGICLGCNGALKRTAKSDIQAALPLVTKVAAAKDFEAEVLVNHINTTPRNKTISSVSRPKIKSFSSASESPRGSERGLELQQSDEDSECTKSRPQTPPGAMEWNYSSSPVIDLNSTILGRIDGGGDDESKSLDSSGGNSFFNSPTHPDVLIGNSVCSPVTQSANSTARIEFALDSFPVEMETQQSKEEHDSQSHELNDYNIEVPKLSGHLLQLESNEQEIHANSLYILGEESETMHEESLSQVCDDATFPDAAHRDAPEIVSSGHAYVKDTDSGPAQISAESGFALGDRNDEPVEVEVGTGAEKSADGVVDPGNFLDLCSSLASNCIIDAMQYKENLTHYPEQTETLPSKAKMEPLALELIRPADSPSVHIESKAANITPAIPEEGADDSNASSNETDSVMISPRVYQEIYELEPIDQLPHPEPVQSNEISTKLSMSMHSLSPVSHNGCESSVALTPESHLSPRGVCSDISSNIYFVSPAPGTHSLDYSESPLCKDWEHIENDVCNQGKHDEGDEAITCEYRMIQPEVSTIKPEVRDESEIIKIAAAEIQDYSATVESNPEEDNQEWTLALANATKVIPVSLMRAALLAIYVFFFSFIALRMARLCFRNDFELHKLVATKPMLINWEASQETQPTLLGIGADDLIQDSEIENTDNAETSKALWTPSFEQPHPAPGIRYVFKLAPTKSKDLLCLPSEPDSKSQLKPPIPEGTVVMQRFQFWKVFNILLAPVRSILRAPQRFLSNSFLSLRQLLTNAK